MITLDHLAHGPQRALPGVLAQAAATEPLPLLQQLDAEQRVGVMAALAVTLAAGGFLLVFIRASGRVARWYVNRPR